MRLPRLKEREDCTQIVVLKIEYYIIEMKIFTPRALEVRMVHAKYILEEI